MINVQNNNQHKGKGNENNENRRNNERGFSNIDPKNHQEPNQKGGQIAGEERKNPNS